jgi:C4-dicarboxylate-specific signal transduction histidine kinase
MDEGAPPDPWLEAANLHATIAQLLSTVIHQVNNALQTIGGHAELLKTDPGVNDTTKRRANTITGVTDRTAEMLASFQVFTRPSAGPTVQNLKDVAVRALAFRHYGLGRARIQAAVQGIDDGLVRAEARPLMQAVLNLILNAEQALTGGRDGRIAIDVSRDAGRIVLSIVDNGPGLPASAAPEGQTRTLGQANRLGLGRRAAAAILARMEGTCEVAPGPAGGTKVTVSLPAAAQD